MKEEVEVAATEWSSPPSPILWRSWHSDDRPHSPDLMSTCESRKRQLMLDCFVHNDSVLLDGNRHTTRSFDIGHVLVGLFCARAADYYPYINIHMYLSLRETNLSGLDKNLETVAVYVLLYHSQRPKMQMTRSMLDLRCCT